MTQFKVLNDEKLEENIRKDYEDFRVKDEASRIQDILIWTQEAQHKDTLRQVLEILDRIENPYSRIGTGMHKRSAFYKAIQTIKQAIEEGKR